MSAAGTRVEMMSNRDFLSNLPDHILLHILSFLPLKDAIATVFLRRFGNLWRHIPVVDFGNCIYRYFDLDNHCFNFSEFIRRLLDVVESDKLDQLYFKVDFKLTHFKDWRRYDDNETAVITEWQKGIRDHLDMLITYALHKQVRVIEFDLRDGKKIRHRDKCYELPHVLTSDYLTNLTLSAVNMKLCTVTKLKVLKVMTLDQVTLTDEVMERILAGCPALEDMALVKCYGLKFLACENPNLKRLKLTLTFKESNILLISCPHVLSFDIQGWVARARLLHTSSSADISIFHSRFCCRRRQSAGVRRLMMELSKCRTFTPCLWTIMVFTIWNFTNVHCPSFEWRNLILKVAMTKWHHPGLSLLLRRNSQSLETLTMSFYPWAYAAQKLLKSSDSGWINEHDFELDDFWSSQEASIFPNLRTITINGFMNEPYVVDIIVFLLRSAPSLEKLVISAQNLPRLTGEESYDLSYFTKNQLRKHSKGYAAELLQYFSQTFESLSKASPDVVISLL